MDEKIQSNTDDKNQEFINDLYKCGLAMRDINRVINEEITMRDLLEEIQYDSDNTRRKCLLEASYLRAYKLDVISLEEFKKQIDKERTQLQELEQSNSIQQLDEQIKNLKEQLSCDEYIYKVINLEVNHYFNNVDPYVNKEDFAFNNKLNQHSKEVFDKIISQSVASYD